jgi:pentatricopeptide repeat protein
VISAYANLKPSMPDECMRLLDEMEDYGIRPNTITFSSLITAFANASPAKPEEAEKVVDRMDATDVEPNTITFSSLITAYANALPGRPDKALEVLHRMKERGIEADTISYNTVVKAYSNTGKPSFFEAMQVHELMQERNVQPNIITWNSLLHAANHDRRQGVLEEATKLYDSIPAGKRDKFTYPAMLHILANARKEVEARAVFEEAMANLPQWPNEFVFKAALRACPSQKTELHALWNQAARQPREVYSGEANRRIALAYRRQKGMQ